MLQGELIRTICNSSAFNGWRLDGVLLPDDDLVLATLDMPTRIKWYSTNCIGVSYGIVSIDDGHIVQLTSPANMPWKCWNGAPWEMAGIPAGSYEE